MDEINNLCLKSLHIHGVKMLTHILNSCLKFSYFPNIWKCAYKKPTNLDTQPQITFLNLTFEENIKRKNFCVHRTIANRHNSLIFKLYKFTLGNQKNDTKLLICQIILCSIAPFTSVRKSIITGCPQGSCLSPILYNIYTSDNCVRMNRFNFYGRHFNTMFGNFILQYD